MDFGSGVVTDGILGLTSNSIAWNVLFSGGAGAVSGPYINLTVDSGTLTDLSGELGNVVSGNLQGYFVGDNPSNNDIVLGFTFASTILTTKHVLVGTMLARAFEPAIFSAPEPSLETHNIDWGTWNNPVEDNWVTVNAVADGVELQAGNHFAMIDPTPIANLTGSASYGTSLASSFIGSGSAGDVTQVVAGMNVDFNTGIISGGSLQVAVDGSQAWEIDFAGSVNGGFVDLNAISGTLSDPGGIISSSIEADLGGVFTGAGAEAFVGGFDLIDEMNQFNEVDGLYTIER